ncbi:MAG TPA: type I restriction endonuclease [bacterium]|nr:type I restriction endonuclease [bacterium]
MDIYDQLKTLQVRIESQLPLITTEESTKNALVMPMLNILGYNVFDPTEVVPEFVADLGIKKGEKVDYAIFRDGKPIILIECKKVGTDLDSSHASQLFRYFSVVDARFAILTNGVVYQFYSDLEKPNQMDTVPFFEFNLLNFKESDVKELKRFSKSSFDAENIQTTASELKYTKEIKKAFLEEYKDPSEEFIKFYVSRVYKGRMTPAVKELFKDLTKKAFQQFVREQLEQKIEGVNKALDEESKAVVEEPPVVAEDAEGKEERIVTTQEEIEGYLIVKSILREAVDVGRVTMRDTISYCGILLDDNNRKPICRLHFNGQKKYLGLMDGSKTETKVPIEDLNDIFKYAEQIKLPIQHYDGPKVVTEEAPEPHS